MKFSRTKRFTLLATIIAIAMYNAIVFIPLFERTGSFWVAYGFTMLSIIIAYGVGMVTIGKERMKSRFYGVPVFTVALTGLALQFIVGLIEIISETDLTRLSVFINVIMLGLCLIGLIGVTVSKEEIERIDQAVIERTFFIKAILPDLETLGSRARPEMKKPLYDLTETVRYSDPMSAPQLAALENQIGLMVTQLTESVSAGEQETAFALCEEIQQLFAERNRKVKMMK